MKNNNLAIAASLIILIVLLYYIKVISEYGAVMGILYYLAAFTGIFLLLEVIFKAVHVKSDTMNSFRLLLISFFCTIIVAELFLQYGLKTYQSYPERNGSYYYTSLYNTSRYQSHLHVHRANQTISFDKKEFSYFRQVNSIGLSEKEIPVEKGENEYRIICLGDSFAEGVGASYDSSWPKVVERELDEIASSKQIKTINAGISGSDVFFEYALLQKKLLPYNPDLVVVAINDSDVGDVLIRGGEERFQPENKIVFRKAPAWEKLYGISYILRHIIHDVLGFNRNFIKKGKVWKEERKAVSHIRSAIEQFVILAKKENFDILFVFHPSSFEVEKGDYLCIFFRDLVCDLKYDDQVQSIDLLELFAQTNTITPENVSEHYWELDYHHNSKGYQIMGDIIAQNIRDRFLPGTGKFTNIE